MHMGDSWTCGHARSESLIVTKPSLFLGFWILMSRSASKLCGPWNKVFRYMHGAACSGSCRLPLRAVQIYNGAAATSSPRPESTKLLPRRDDGSRLGRQKPSASHTEKTAHFAPV